MADRQVKRVASQFAEDVVVLDSASEPPLAPRALLATACADQDRLLKPRAWLFDDHTDGLITREEYLERRERTDTELANVAAKVAALESAQATFHEEGIVLPELAANRRRVFELTEDPEHRRRLVRLVFPNPRLRPRGSNTACASRFRS